MTELTDQQLDNINKAMQDASLEDHEPTCMCSSCMPYPPEPHDASDDETDDAEKADTSNEVWFPVISGEGDPG